VKELKVFTPDEAEARTFIISAKEALQYRVKERNGLQSISETLLRYRHLEFLYFERELDKYISSLAITNKFKEYLYQANIYYE